MKIWTPVINVAYVGLGDLYMYMTIYNYFSGKCHI